MRTRLTPALLVLLAPAWIGCRTYATAHGYPEMATQIPQLGVTSTIPKTQAAFCLDRAQRRLLRGGPGRGHLYLL